MTVKEYKVRAESKFVTVSLDVTAAGLFEACEIARVRLKEASITDAFECGLDPSASFDYFIQSVHEAGHSSLQSPGVLITRSIAKR